jgi:hypothetical protein
MSQRCELCGDTFHQEPDTRQDQFGQYCPGAGADQEQRDTYVQAVMEGYLNLLTVEADHYADEIERKKRLWYDRTRSEATHEELQADCDQRVQEVGERVPVEPSELVIDLSDLIDLPHLTVPGEVPEKRSPLIQVSEKDKTEPTDALLWMPTQEDDSDGTD